ncbi:MAG: cation diffusion facilitator family transporter [Thermoguttaceae bacterium]|nr:cation diffusion facilitator family transporter [Thermoguttaceae bacterium]
MSSPSSVSNPPLPTVTKAESARHEKNAAAVASVTAAVGLTSMKLVVGWWTNSLGILSEAAHSGLDLVAAVVACWAVHIAARPADANHPYGHGKVESLSALFETGLLLVTCVWIVWESVHRLVAAEAPEVTVNFWAFAVVVISIVVDVVRSRHLRHVARKHQSEALEADALHFSTDVWSSCVVLVGLIGMYIAQHVSGMQWLQKADTCAALGVAMLVTWVSIQMGYRSICSLVDAVSPNESAHLESILREVNDGRELQCRMRRSGPEVFVEVIATVDPTTSFEQTHALTERIEQAVQSLYSMSVTTVHCEPSCAKMPLRSKILLVAAKQGLEIHHLQLTATAEGMKAELHIEFPSEYTVRQAHEKATQLETQVKDELKNIHEIVTHCEPAETHASIAHAAQNKRPSQTDEQLFSQIDDAIHVFRKEEPLCLEAHAVRLLYLKDEMCVSLHVVVDGDTPLPMAHRMTERLEQFLRLSVPELQRISIHVEPATPA